MRAIWAIVICAALASCAQPAPYEVLQAYYAHSGPEETPDERLQTVTFARIHGMSRSQALSYLQADGFDCQGITCVYFNQTKQSTADILFGTASPQDKVFADRRANKNSFSLSLVAEVIESPDQIYADARHFDGDVPWHRGFRPYDFEVTDD
ncbi:hypothetical protein [Pseudophaeobacter sp.]|uniref:hypothetical protein n=1 Tax=Pseudophaeobacter sp. TaxID=1971739 RepID=UPI003297EEED